MKGFFIKIFFYFFACANTFLFSVNAMDIPLSPSCDSMEIAGEPSSYEDSPFDAILGTSPRSSYMNQRLVECARAGVSVSPTPERIKEKIDAYSTSTECEVVQILNASYSCFKGVPSVMEIIRNFFIAAEDPIVVFESLRGSHGGIDGILRGYIFELEGTLFASKVLNERFFRNNLKINFEDYDGHPVDIGGEKVQLANTEFDFVGSKYVLEFKSSIHPKKKMLDQLKKERNLLAWFKDIAVEWCSGGLEKSIEPCRKGFVLCINGECTGGSPIKLSCPEVVYDALDKERFLINWLVLLWRLGNLNYIVVFKNEVTDVTFKSLLEAQHFDCRVCPQWEMLI